MPTHNAVQRREQRQAIYQQSVQFDQPAHWLCVPFLIALDPLHSEHKQHGIPNVIEGMNAGAFGQLGLYFYLLDMVDDIQKDLSLCFNGMISLDSCLCLFVCVGGWMCVDEGETDNLTEHC